MKQPLGKLESVPPRDYWQDEARDFTPWLAQEENLQLLSETIGIDLELTSTEAPVGAFKADILAKEVGTEDFVVIENQLEKTNHDHLGKLITYAAGLNAKAVVWVTAELTDEHRKALDWLNDISGEACAFFGLEVELWRIGNSSPAPKFNPVCQPNEWAKSITSSDEDREPTETKLLQFEFWRGLVDAAKIKGTFLRLRKPRPQHWYSLAVGRSRFHLSLTVNTQRQRLGCELYIRHKDSKQAFALLAADKVHIESELDAQLEWHELPHKKDCRIVQYRPGIVEDHANWPELHAWLLERVEAFYRTFSPRVKALDLGDEEQNEEQ
jgi:hypothetical protein